MERVTHPRAAQGVLGRAGRDERGDLLGDRPTYCVERVCLGDPLDELLDDARRHLDQLPAGLSSGGWTGSDAMSASGITWKWAKL